MAMWGLESLGIPGLNIANGAITGPVWLAAAAAALIVVFMLLAVLRSGFSGTLSFLAIAAAAVWLAIAWYDSDKATERRSIEARMTALETPVLAPGNPVACVDAFSGDPLDAACERLLFTAPETVAAASSYVAARLVLLGEALTYAARRDPSFESKLDRFRAPLERDRYGLVAHVLEVGNRCTPQQCEAYRLFRDPARVRANLGEKTYQGLLTRYSPQWSNRAQAQAPIVATPMSSNYTLPSSSSIPPVSIMTSEPTTPPAAAAPPPAEPRAAAPPAAQTRPPQRPAQARPQALPPPPRPQ
jgi:hypothetical protein